MKIKIELFGSTKDFSSEEIIELNLKNNSHIRDLRKELIKLIEVKHKGNKTFRKVVQSSVFCTDDNNIVHDDYLISREQKIAIIPPIAGG